MPKQTLRRAMLDRRHALSQAEVDEASKMVFQRLKKLHVIRDAKEIVAYYPFRQEISLIDFMQDIIQGGRKLYLPKFLPKEKKYLLAEVTDLEKDLVKGKFGILEPADSALQIPVEALQHAAWIVPGVAFDSEGNRLGRGGGYYDQFLKEETLSIAVAYNWQLVEQIPTELHDIKMKYLVTDKGELKFD